MFKRMGQKIFHNRKGSYVIIGRFTFEQIHNTKQQFYFYERAENHKTKEWTFKSFK